jgi:ATP-dependent DNA ligase
MIEVVILNMIAELSSTTKKKEKEAIITEYYNKHADDGLGKFFDLTLNPRRLFYVKSLERLKPSAAPAFVRPEVTAEYIIEKLYSNKNRSDIMNTLFECIHYATSTTKNIVNIILAKDLNCGVGISTVNSAVGFKMIKDFEVAKAEEQKKIEAFHAYEKFYWNLKVDGQRLIVLGNIHNDFLFLSSSGKEITQLYITELGKQLRLLVQCYLKDTGKKSVCFDAELLGVDENLKELDRKKSNGICTKMQNMNATPEEVYCMRAWIFDVIGYDTEELVYEGTSKPLYERVGELDRMKFIHEMTKNDKLIFLPYTIVNSVDELMEQFKILVQNGYEGVIAKKYDSPYEIKRQNHWVKLKKEVEIDVVVTGWTPHKKRDDMIGALLIESSCGSIKGAIGTGTWLTEQKRRELHTRALMGELDGTILEIGVMEITSNKKNDELSFYLPRITRERTDKTEADSYEKIMSMF